MNRRTYSTAETLHTPCREIHPFPGLFFYEGFGYGHYYSTDGHTYWGSFSECQQMADNENVKLVYVDSLEGYKAVYLGD